jgi:hypothetical protein
MPRVVSRRVDAAARRGRTKHRGLRERSAASSMTPIFDRNAEHVGWVSEDWQYVFGAEMRWIGYIHRGDAWSASTGDWVGPVLDGNFYDRSGHPIAWTKPPLVQQGAFKKPLQPLRPLPPQEPEKPPAPGRPEKPPALIGAWSSTSFRAAFE